ncbi:MAG: CidA/LrgA family protein [Polyangiales bacterium]
MKLRAVFQVGILAALYFACDLATRALHLPLPGNVVGAIVLAVLLLTGIVPLRWVDEGADLLLHNLPLLFVPAAVLVVRVIPSLKRELPAIAIVMVVTTFVVMAVAGLLAERWRKR